MSSNVGQDILRSQQESLDATDALASVWSVAVAEAAARDDNRVSWGGRGKGGRGTARRTFQPFDIVVDNVDLEYMNDASVTGSGGGGSKVLLSDAYIKLLPGRVYTLIGRNGVGKSSLLRRIQAGKIPGFPPHISSILVPQEVFGHDELTPVDIVLEKQKLMREQTESSNEFSISQLEEEMDALDMDTDDAQERMEDICHQIADLEDSDFVTEEEGITMAHDALHFFGIPESVFGTPTSKLSGGIRKKVALSCALMERPQLLLLDEPTCHIDVGGILQLRQLIQDCVDSNTTVVLISHDVDLMNDVATDVIHFAGEKLSYYPGNYRHFIKYRKERITHQLKQAGALEKQRNSIIKSIDNLKSKTEGKSNETKKKLNKAVKSREKKLERHGVEKNERGHRRVAQTDGGMRIGSINTLGAEKRKNLTHKDLVKLAEVDIGPIPDKAVQFDFRDSGNSWGDEPLASIMDVGHSYGDKSENDWTHSLTQKENADTSSNLIFDCVDISIREGSRITILGENGSGKTSLLSIISGEMTPSHGQVQFASGLKVAHFHQHSVDDLIYDHGNNDNGGIVTALSYLVERFPKESEQGITEALVRFGLSLKQASTNVRFLSGGERCRLCMASIMLDKPDLLVIDEISNHLDVESVEALIYGLNKWKGTLVLASHDSNLIRSIGAETFVLFDGGLRRVDKGIDSYLQIFAKHYHKPNARG